MTNGNDPRPPLVVYKPFCFPPLLNKMQDKGTQGVRARCDAELPPCLSIVQHPCHPIILGMEMSESVSSRLWCVLGFAAVFVFALEPSKLQIPIFQGKVVFVILAWQEVGRCGHFDSGLVLW